MIPNHIIKAYKDIGTEEDQVLIINTLEDIILPISALKDNHFHALIGFYKDLTVDSRAIFDNIIKSKRFWSQKLIAILDHKNSNEYDQMVSLFFGHLKEPLNMITIKEGKSQHSAALNSLLKQEEISDSLIGLAKPNDYSTKLDAVITLMKASEKQHESLQTLINQIKAKCTDTFISINYVVFLINTDSDCLQLLRTIGNSYPDTVMPFIPQILEILEDCPDKSPILDLLCSILGNTRLSSQQKNDLQVVLRQMCVKGSVEEAKAATKLAITSMPNNFIQMGLLDSIVPKLLVTSEDPNLLISHLSALREIILNCPDEFGDYCSTALNFVVNELLVAHTPSQKNELIISDIVLAKIEGVKLMVS